MPEDRSLDDFASPERPDGRVDLVDAVHEAVAAVDAGGAAVTVETPAEAWIRADDSVEFPIGEVFENAVTHNDGETRRVEATIRENGTTTCLEVTDNGPGIPPDERAVLQAEEETPLSHASSIWLWLVKWMCETQGGTVRFDATDDGTPALTATADGLLRVDGTVVADRRLTALVAGDLRINGRSATTLPLTVTVTGDIRIDATADADRWQTATATTATLRVDGTAVEPTLIIPITREYDAGLEYDRESDEFDLG